MVISGFLLPRYYHKYHVIATFIVFLLPQTPRLLPRYHQKQQEIACFQPSGKVNFNHQASSPEALPNFAQGFGHLCPELSVNSAHVLGHPCSCTRAQILMYVGTSYTNFPKLGDFARVRAKSYLAPSSNCERARSQKSPFIPNMR